MRKHAHLNGQSQLFTNTFPYKFVTILKMGKWPNRMCCMHPTTNYTSCSILLILIVSQLKTNSKLREHRLGDSFLFFCFVYELVSYSFQMYGVS